MTNKTESQKVLVIRLSSLGDILLTFPALSELIEQKKEVHLLTKEKFEEVSGLLPGIARIHTIPDHASLGDLYQQIKKLKLLSFDCVYDLHSNLRSRIVTALLGISSKRIKKHRIKEWILFVFRKSFYRAIGLKPQNRIEEALKTISDQKSFKNKMLPASIGNDVQNIPAFAEWKKRNPKYVCISSESAWEQKAWPQDRFINIAKELVEKKYSVIWLGLKPLPKEAQIENSLNLVGQLTVSEVATVLKSADFLLCNDSGLMHLSETVGTPVIAIFGPTSSELGFAPRLPQSQIVEISLWCRPCSKTGRLCFRVLNPRKCLKLVTESQVIQSVEKLEKVLGQEKKGSAQNENLDL